MTEILAKHAFVGVVDRYLCLSLIQHSTKLFLVNYASLALVPIPLSIWVNKLIMGRDEYFYQLGLRQFGTMDRLKLDPPPDLKELLRLAAAEEDLGAHNLEVEDVVNVSFGDTMS